LLTKVNRWNWSIHFLKYIFEQSNYCNAVRVEWVTEAPETKILPAVSTLLFSHICCQSQRTSKNKKTLEVRSLLSNFWTVTLAFTLFAEEVQVLTCFMNIFLSGLIHHFAGSMNMHIHSVSQKMSRVLSAITLSNLNRLSKIITTGKPIKFATEYLPRLKVCCYYFGKMKVQMSWNKEKHANKMHWFFTCTCLM